MSTAAAAACIGCERTSPPRKQLLPARNAAPGVFLCERCVDECTQAIADAPTRIPGATNACDFCSKREGHVAMIITTGRARICDECVDAFRAALKS